MKVVVEPVLAAGPQWKQEVNDLFESAGRLLQKYSSVTFVVDTLAVWDIVKSSSYRELFIGDCLIKEVPKDGRDLVVFFSHSAFAPSLIASMTYYELGYAFVPLQGAVSGRLSNGKNLLILTHWLAHMFGAAHCYFDKNNILIMNPFIHDGMLVESTGDSTGSTARFHTGNLRIMRCLAGRPFDENGWDRGRWADIAAVYRQVKQEYNPWKFNANKQTIAEYESDAFHEGNLLLFQSSWASLCGMHAEALRYLDTLELLYRAMKNTCLTEEMVGKTRLCDVCGFDRTGIVAWFEVQTFYCGMRRAIVLSRMHDFSAADSCFDSAMGSVPADLALVKDKLINGYRYYRERYGGNSQKR